jgi:hypothetical protein
LTTKNVRGVCVEPDDKPPGDLNSTALERLHRFLHATRHVLQFTRFQEGFLHRCLESDKDHVKSTTDQEIHQRIITGKVDTGLGRELERVIVFNLPVVYRAQELFHASTIPDEVIIDDKEITFETEIVRRL